MASNAIETIDFMHDFIRKAKPKINFRHDLLEEGILLKEQDRLEMLASTAHERKREENETEIITEALKKEKHDEFVAKKRKHQLIKNTDELRTLCSYIATAETSKDLIAQLKLQDEKIEKRFKEAARMAEELRAHYRDAQLAQKKLEEEQRQAGELVREELKLQIEEHDYLRAEEKEEQNRIGAQMRQQQKDWEKKEMDELIATRKAKCELRKEILEGLEKKKELLKEGKAQDTNAILLQYETERRREDMQKAIKEARQAKIRHRAVLSSVIGERVQEIEGAKRQAVCDLIDWWAKERYIKDKAADQEEAQKANEIRRQLQLEVALHSERKRAEQEEEKQITMELIKERRAAQPPDPEVIKRQKQREIERWDAEQYLKAKALMQQIAKTEGEQTWEQQLYKNYKLEEQKLQNEIEDVRKQILYEKPLPLLRYLPSQVVRSDYLPEPLGDQVREEVRKDPIPMLTKKRHQPHLLRFRSGGGELIKCCKNCTHPKLISKIF